MQPKYPQVGYTPVYYVLEILPEFKINDITNKNEILKNTLTPNKIFIIYNPDTLKIFVWIGNSVNNEELKRFAFDYANNIKEKAAKDAGLDLGIEIITQGNEPVDFQLMMNIAPLENIETEENNTNIEPNNEIVNAEDFDKSDGKETALKTSDLDKNNINTEEDIKRNGESKVLRKEVIQKIDKMLQPFKGLDKKEAIRKKNQIKLPEGVRYEDYELYCDTYTPFGIDRLGRAYLFPQKSDVAHRMDLKYIVKYDNKGKIKEEYGEDWGSLRRSGIGWKIVPTIYIILFCFVPDIIIFPILVYIYGGPEYVVPSIYEQIYGNVPYILMALYMVKLINFSLTSFDNLAKPYGKYSRSFRILWKDDLEFLKFESDFFENTLSQKWTFLGLISALAFLIFAFFDYYLKPEKFLSTTDILPASARWLVLFNNIGLALLLMLIVGFLFAVINGLFKIAKLADHAEDLSIWEYRKMIQTINKKLTHAQLMRSSIGGARDIGSFAGRTYYEFQRGSRRIGELLFKVSGFFILFSILVGLGILTVRVLNLVPSTLESNTTTISFLTSIFGVLSFTLFIFPQLNMHHFLKSFKYELIDEFSEMKSRFEYLYYDSLLDPTLVKKLNPNWSSIRDIQFAIEHTNNTIEQIQGYGTWIYDFPEVLKVVGVALSTFLPAVLDLIV